MTGEWERNVVGEDWLGIGSANVYMGILSGSEHLSGNAPPERRESGDGQTERSRSLLERASISAVSDHSLCMGNVKLFLARASSKVASYQLPRKPPQVNAETMNL